MLFHRAHHRPRDHDRWRWRVPAVFLFRRLTRFANRVPARVDLQVGGNDAAEFTGNGRGKRRFSPCSRGRRPRLFGN
jgi:hypothetical protein